MVLVFGLGMIVGVFLGAVLAYVEFERRLPARVRSACEQIDAEELLSLAESAARCAGKTLQ